MRGVRTGESFVSGDVWRKGGANREGGGETDDDPEKGCLVEIGISTRSQCTLSTTYSLYPTCCSLNGTNAVEIIDTISDGNC
jgi:hypothetical protein